MSLCTTDMSVRIWNIKEMGCDLAKYFDDEAYSISLHPSGLHVLVGFADKVDWDRADTNPGREFVSRP